MLTRRIDTRQKAGSVTDEFSLSPAPGNGAAGTIFRSGRNAWRVVRAERARVLLDAAIAVSVGLQVFVSRRRDQSASRPGRRLRESTS